VILVDANLLLYATISNFEQHEPARAWLDETLNAAVRVGLPWPSLLAFLRISTNQRIFPRPLSVRQAWRRVAIWLDLPTVWIPEPSERHRLPHRRRPGPSLPLVRYPSSPYKGSSGNFEATSGVAGNV